jgi:hypothetical protein
MKIKTKAFLDLMLIHSKTPRRAKRIMEKDKRLTRDEKRIVNCFMMMRSNQNREGLIIAEDIPSQSDLFVEAMRLFVIAGFLNNLNQHQKSLVYFQQCYVLLPKNIVRRFEFVTLLNIFNLYINLRNFKNAFEIIGEMEKIPSLEREDLIALDRCQFNYFTLTENSPKASEYFDIVFKNINDYPEHTRAVVLLDIWDYGITFQKYELCRDILKRMKKQRNYILSSYYNYMKILFYHLIENKPIYLVQSDYRDYPELKNQLNLIRALELNQINEAIGIWNKLHEKKPEVFAKKFKCLGQKTIFSLCLEKYRSKLLHIREQVELDKNDSIMLRIEKSLTGYQEISKNDLFQMIYGRNIESKNDLNRLARDIYKFKKKKNLEINSKKGVYTLLKKVS